MLCYQIAAVVRSCTDLKADLYGDRLGQGNLKILALMAIRKSADSLQISSITSNAFRRLFLQPDGYNSSGICT
jgi:hypothetical protein